LPDAKTRVPPRLPFELFEASDMLAEQDNSPQGLCTWTPDQAAYPGQIEEEVDQTAIQGA
jgi:hypothetical protein